MAAVIKSGWSKPSAILFASELPADDKAFSFALAQAVELRADLVIFHANDQVEVAATGTLEKRCGDYTLKRVGRRRLDPLAQRASDLSIHCKSVEQPGVAADQILAFLHEHKIDRIVIGAQSPGPVGELLVDSVAEAVLRNANAPVFIVSSNVIEESYRNFSTRKILCDVSKREVSRVVASFGAELARRHKASLILQQVIPPQESSEVLDGRTFDQMEAELPSLVPAKLQNKIHVQTRVAVGDPTEELLFLARAQQANFIVMGAHGASQFAAVTRAGTIYKVLAYADCPVVTLSPVLLAKYGANETKPRLPEVNYLAGVV
jgi:nucleotide-binding universal stress UspA family protein